MTKREYIEHIRANAAAYLSLIERDSSGQAYLRSPAALSWHNTKESLSPFDMIELCDAWLERESGK